MPSVRSRYESQEHRWHTPRIVSRESLRINRISVPGGHLTGITQKVAQPILFADIPAWMTKLLLIIQHHGQILQVWLITCWYCELGQNISHFQKIIAVLPLNSRISKLWDMIIRGQDHTLRLSFTHAPIYMS